MIYVLIYVLDILISTRTQRQMKNQERSAAWTASMLPLMALCKLVGVGGTLRFCTSYTDSIAVSARAMIASSPPGGIHPANPGTHFLILEDQDFFVNYLPVYVHTAVSFFFVLFGSPLVLFLFGPASGHMHRYIRLLLVRSNRRACNHQITKSSGVA